MTKTKICIRCGVEKDITEFYNNFGNKDYYSNICKECQLKANKEWLRNNKERKKELNRRYYEKRKAEFLSNNGKDIGVKVVEGNGLGLNQDNNKKH